MIEGMVEPKIRFVEYEGDWSKCNLEDCLTISNERNNKMTYGKEDALSVSDDCGVVNQIQHLGRSYVGIDVSNYKILGPGQVVYTKSPLKAKPYGIVKVNSGDAGIVSVLYAIYNVKEGVLPDYIHFYFAPFFRVNKYLLPLINKGAKNTINISDEMALNGYITIPKNISEQQQIASYFKSLDSLIQATTRKISSLKQLKSASLLSMFPRAGETKPHVRFKGFEGEWKSSTAIEVFKTYDERNRPDLPVLSACQDIRGMTPRSISGYDISHDKSNEITYKRVLPGQFVIHLRSFQGGFAHSSVEGITSPAYTVFGFKDNSLHYDYYWKYVFMSKNFIERLKTITYGIRDGRSISFKELAEMQFVYPSYDEQRLIAKFFRSLDTQISLEAQRLEKLKQIKSACLDKMFV